VETENLLRGTVGGFRMTREGVESVSIEDVDGDGPSSVRPKAGGGGIADDGDVLSLIVERHVLCIEDSVCVGDIARGRGGEGRKVGGDKMGGLKPKGMRHSYGLLSRLGRSDGTDGSDAVGG
jgi:hypothetical protein